MAIEKDVVKPNGVTLAYHRVVSVNSIVNKSVVIEVASYISREQRMRESDAADSGEAFDVLVSTRYVEAPYDPDMTTTLAYEYIKGIEPFNGSEDVFENGNDPVAVALSEAKGGITSSDLVSEKPVDKVGFVAVPSIENLGYSIVWELVEDPEYDPLTPDGTFLKPFPFAAGMDVERGMHYTDGEYVWECVQEGTAEAFTAPWFEVLA